MPNIRRTRLNAFLMFIVFTVAVNVFQPALGAFLVFVAKVIDANDRTWHPSTFIWWEAASFIACFAATLIVAWLQRRQLSELGYRLRGAFGQLWRGSLFGIVAVVLLVSSIAALGGFSFGHLAMSGTRLAAYTIAWLVAFIGVGLAEEAEFRSAGQILLSEAIGAWPAIAVISLLFGGIHYFQKPMENLADATSVTLLGVFMAFTVLRSGSIWFAVAFHTFFDYCALFVFGAPNSGNFGKPVATKLLTGDYHGPAWLTGGPLGVEASWLVFPLIALLFLTYHFSTRSSATRS
jgi:membrane protease YdiL (CAAX protease family)